MDTGPGPNMPACACTECRRRKLGCSKELPSCKECRRLGTPCVYESREKPGLKTGAVENLNRRVDKIERLLEQQQAKSTPTSCGLGCSEASNAWHPDESERSPRLTSDLFRRLEIFERELKELKALNRSQAVYSPSVPSSQDRDFQSRGPIRRNNIKRQGEEIRSPETKRLRRETGEHFFWGELVSDLVMDHSAIFDGLSRSGLLGAIVDSYFSQVHPWLPILHEITFRQQLSKQVYEASLEVILRAMIYSAVRFVNRVDTQSSFSQISQLMKSSRDWVMLQALNSLSLENLQALLIIAFDDIGRGDAVNVWSIVGSLTRTVEYLQLSVEVEESDEQPLLKPCNSLLPPKNWTEMETRRRVFWNVFNLDRFCSVVTGWNTSLTSDDVHRRLPVDGFFWRKQEPVIAPFFGIWDKSAGRIGNSITFLPTSADEEHQSPKVNGNFTQDTNDNGISTIGALAYCIEATESMSRVTTYFLQQKVNLHDQRQISRWLTRFKELDLRLVHWKMFLPQKWKDTNLSRKATEVIMDPNLTLAHITHNASMILLHQLIAYPPADWDWGNRLPSSCSAETCKTAALETSSIIQNYVRSPTTSRIVNSQFVFCIFIAARVLLIQWRYYEDKAILPEFFRLVDCLDAFSTRWEGVSSPHSGNHTNLASKYASLLCHMHERHINDSTFRLNVLSYANELSNGVTQMYPPPSKDQDDINYENRVEVVNSGGNVQLGIPKSRQSVGRETQDRDMLETDTPISRANQVKTGTTLVDSPSSSQQHINTEPPMSYPMSGEQYSMVYPLAISGDSGENVATDDFSSISRTFFDQQFLDRDRVISYNEGMFTTDMGWWVETKSA